MLSKSNNEFLTRVGPGKPMGELLRRFWVPGSKGAGDVGKTVTEGAKGATDAIKGLFGK